jgi:hypothetical protein
MKKKSNQTPGSDILVSLQLYVIEHYLHCAPRLIICELIKETPSVYVVKIRDGRKQFHKGTSGRHYFKTQQGCIEYLRKNCCNELDSAKRMVALMETLTATNDGELIAFTQGIDSVCDRIHTEARHRCKE